MSKWILMEKDNDGNNITGTHISIIRCLAYDII